MERGLGADLGHARVHTDAGAAALSRRLDAKAFAVGEHIAFSEGAYAPGTLAGDALIAHELVHTVQQRNAGPSSPSSDSQALERDADRATVGVMGRLVTGAQDFGSGLGSTVRSNGLAVSRCTPDPKQMSEVTTPTLTQADYDFLESLEGFESVEENYDTYKAEQRAATAEIAAAGTMGGAEAAQAVASSPYGASARSMAAVARFREHAQESGESTDLNAWQAKKERFEGIFERAAVAEAYAELDRHEKLIQGELDRYSTATGLAEIRTALQPHQPALTQARQKRLAAAPVRRQIGRSAMMVDPPGAEKNRAAARALAQPVRTALGPKFPILLSDDIEIDRVLLDPDAEAQGYLQRIAGGHVEAIRATRGALDEKPKRVWKFDRAVQLARARLEITDGSIYDLMIKDRYASEAWDELFKNLLIGALAIGLGLLTAGTGTVAVLAAAGGAGLSAGAAYAHVRDYLIAQAATGTALQKAEAISSEEPSLFWLAVDVLVAFVDLGMAAKAFSGLKTVARGVKTVEDAEKLRAPAKALAEAEKAASPAKGIDPDAVAETVVQEAKNHITAEQAIKAAEAAEPAFVASLRLLVKDEQAIAGLLKIQRSVLSTIMSLFKGNALEKLGRLVAEFPQVTKTLEGLAAKLPREQFQAALGKYLFSRGVKLESKYLLRAAADAELTLKDYEIIADALKTTKSSKEIGKKISGLIMERIAERLPGGEKGIKAWRELATGLHPKQSGTLFERWVSRHIWKNAERFSKKTAQLAEEYKSANPKFQGDSITTDNVLRDAARPGEAGIGEAKGYLNRGNVGAPGGHPRMQAENYAEMLRVGVKTPKGERFTWIEYLFANKGSAEASEEFLVATFRDRVKIFFVDEKGVKTLLVRGAL